MESHADFKEQSDGNSYQLIQAVCGALAVSIIDDACQTTGKVVWNLIGLANIMIISFNYVRV